MQKSSSSFWVSFCAGIIISSELLLYFVYHIGFSLHLGRVLQLFFVPLFLIVIIKSGPITLTNKTKQAVMLVTIWCIYEVLVYSFSIFFEIDALFNFKHLFLFFYQIIIFVFLPLFLLRNRHSIFIFVKTIRVVLWISVIVGFIDLIGSFFEIDLVARHISDGRNVGKRFHGLFGEPRDAAVSISFLLIIEAIWGALNERKLSFVDKKIIFLFFCLFFTFSFSMIAGLIIFLLFWLFLPFKKNLKNFFLLLLIMLFFFYAIFSFSNRLKLYLDDFINILWIVYYFDYQNVPNVFLGQMPNLVPISGFLERLKTFSPLALFGSGIGSVIISNIKSGLFISETVTSFSNISRFLIEKGVLGMTLYIYTHLKIFYKTVMNFDSKLIIYTLMVLGFSMSLAHRSPISFMLLGISIVMINLYNNEN